VIADVLPGAFTRWRAVWWRNALVWRKSAGTALLGGFAEPLCYLFALGYGLGSFVGNVEGVSYIVFLTSGILATSSMNAATFEGLYLAYTRMEVLRTWDGMLSAPLNIADVVMGEILWMGTKSLISASLILVVTAVSGLVHSWTALGVLPVAFLAGLCFGSMALVITSYSRSYDFFVYYISLAVTPMVLLSGVFFPLHALPGSIQAGSALLPLQHVVAMMRALISGQAPADFGLHFAVPLIFSIVAAAFVMLRLKKRLLQ
jgi:lipooligosaccharide transport system permease protein